MGNCISANAMMTCSFGLTPSVFMPTQCMKIQAKGTVGCIMDATPANILPFGLCSSLANPLVNAATIAALGALTPLPCTPIPVGLWLTPKMTVLVNNSPILTTDSQLFCAYGGLIKFTCTPSMNVSI